DYAAAWRADHPDYAAAWRADHPDYAAAWRADHPDYAAAWRADHPEARATTAAWKADHPEQIRAYEAARRSARRDEELRAEAPPQHVIAAMGRDQRIEQVRLAVARANRVTVLRLRSILLLRGFRDELLAERMYHMRRARPVGETRHFDWDEIVTFMLRDGDWGYSREEREWQAGLGRFIVEAIAAAAAAQSEQGGRGGETRSRKRKK
ncbi:hypothetical protein ScalyP_jg1414, partial [Parmales sp. scaly parma]